MICFLSVDKMATFEDCKIEAIPEPSYRSHISNIEYLTLVESTSFLARAISIDPLEIAQKCFEQSMFSEDQMRSVQLDAKDSYTKASELVTLVTTKIQDFPEKFHVFMRILRELHYMQDVVIKVNEKYELKKMSAFERSHGTLAVFVFEV